VRGTHKGGLHPAGSSGARRVAARLKLPHLAMVGESSKGRFMTRLGKMGAAQDAEH
jgi:hypothetical protein